MPGPAGKDGLIQSIIAGANITVDNTDPANPIVSSTGGGGGGTTNYSDLTNKPKINGVELSGDKSSSMLGLATASQGSKADTALQSFTESDPTVPSWAKQATKPSYTAGEVGAAPALGTDDNYVTDAEKTAIGTIGNKVDKVAGKGLIDDAITSRLSYNAAEDTLSYTRADGGTTEFGKEIVDNYTDLDTVDLVAGDIVSVVGATGNRSAIKLTDASNQTLALATIGMVTVPLIAQNNTGVVAKQGKVHELNTITYTEGTRLYVHPTNKGKWTSTKPTSGYIISIGTVVVSHATQGIIDLDINVIPVASDIITDATHRFITDTQLTNLGNQSGTNTGDQDLSGLVVKNAAITGATKTKITYDVKGLVTSGADATTADIADSTDKRYVTDAQKTVVGNTSGVNTGDETASTIKTKLGITTLSGSNTGDQDLSGLASTASVALKRDKTEIGDAHGFINPPNSSNFTISNTGASITVNLLSNAGNYKINGTDYTNNGLTITFTASLGQNFICVNSSGLVNTAIDILDLTKIPCCTVNWDGTTATLADELHRSNRNLVQHKKEHDTDGARWVSGFATTFGSSANNTFNSALGTIRDEERYHDIAAKTNGMILYRNAAQTAMIADAASTRFTKLVNTTTGAPYYDNAGTLTALGANNYGIMWMYATNRKLPVDSEIIFVMGQGSYSSIAAAQSATQPTIVGMTAVEWKLLYRVVIRNVGGALNFIQADDLRTTTTGLAVSGSGLTSLPATQVTETVDGNAQTAIDKLRIDCIPIYCSDMLSDISASTSVAKIRFTFNEARTLSSIVGDLQTAAVGGLFTVDIKKNGTSIFSTLLTFDSTENTTRTAATSYVLTGAISFAIGDYVDIYVTNAGSTTAGKGLLITLLTTK